MKAKVEMKKTLKEDKQYGDVIQQDIKVDMQMRQTILMANLETQKRVILAMRKLVEVQQFDEMNAKKTYQLARRDLFSAV